ncbi:hypothetical protein [Anabaena azotica]|uniref:Uncharacterized protein n=1 Tax=Anabaena azotica FACHB-119 TaxID=947527 RepID=A0ABR8D773_9NOST|nr:hypothetical protein [Anabaena azotica]MBD2502786.1 hypothetical protein [Anabaena azotica FACHB-119]
MISLLQRHQMFVAWFLSGLLAVILLYLGTAKQPALAIAVNQQNLSVTQPTSGNPEFFASHEEPNFYQ